jgi:uncharacterized membrane protein YeaQ/YmgE (transglycosylase-associated protein family)
MNSLIVISWVTVGAFAAWIGRHLVRDKSTARSSGIGNLAVGVLGALLGGFFTHAMLRGAPEYHQFLLCAGGALLVSSFLIGITRFTPRRRAGAHV